MALRYKTTGTSKKHPSASLPTNSQSSRTSMYVPVARLLAPSIWALFRGSLTLSFFLLLLGTCNCELFASELQNIEQTEARALYAEGLQEHRMNHIHASISKFEQALALWPEFSSAKIKLDSSMNELKKMIDEGYARGLGYFQSLYYERAIKEWQVTLALIGDPNDEQYKKIEQEINLAKLQIMERSASEPNMKRLPEG